MSAHIDLQANHGPATHVVDLARYLDPGVGRRVKCGRASLEGAVRPGAVAAVVVPEASGHRELVAAMKFELK